MVNYSIIIAAAPDRNIEVKESLKDVDYDKRKYEVIIEKGWNPSLNRNKGVKKARGEIIVFLDDDAFVDPNLLKEADKFFSKYKDINIVGGPQLTPKSDKFFARLSGYGIASLFGTGKMSNRYKKSRLNLDDGGVSLTSANCFLKKNVFKRTGYFNEKLFPGEDPEFFFRAKKAGLKIAYNPDLIIYHKRRDSISGFLKQFFLYGKVSKNVGDRGLVFYIPVLFFLYIIFLPLLVWISNYFLIPLIFYGMLAVIFAFYDSAKEGSFVSLFLLPFIYLMIHLSYGAGKIFGMFE